MEKAKAKKGIAEESTVGAWRPLEIYVYADRIQCCPNVCPQKGPTSNPMLRIQDIWMLGRTRQTAWELSLPSRHL